MKSIYDFEKKQQWDIAISANIFDSFLAKAKLYAKTIDEMQQVMVQMNDLCHLHVFMYEHAISLKFNYSFVVAKIQKH